MLEINTLRNGELQIVEEDFFPSTPVSEAVNAVQAFAHDVNVRLELQAMPAALSTTKVHGGADSFKKILANVVDNAVRYNKVNGSVSVAASLEQTGESSAELKCTVRDTGIGMSPETVERVSEPFFQADEGARSQYPGSGLGMSIVADLLRLLNGSFDISSTPGKGTVVCISVPLTVVATNCEPEQQLPRRTISPECGSCLWKTMSLTARSRSLFCSIWAPRFPWPVTAVKRFMCSNPPKRVRSTPFSWTS